MVWGGVAWLQVGDCGLKHPEEGTWVFPIDCDERCAALRKETLFSSLLFSCLVLSCPAVLRKLCRSCHVRLRPPAKLRRTFCCVCAVQQPCRNNWQAEWEGKMARGDLDNAVSQIV